MRLVWDILRVKNRTCITVAALQYVGKSMGPKKKNYMHFDSCEHEGKELILQILFSIIFQS